MSELLCATQYGYYDIVEKILKKKVDINFQGKYGYTSLIISAKNNYPKIIKLLLNSKDIDINICDKDGHTAFDWALNNNNIVVIIYLYLYILTFFLIFLFNYGKQNN